RPERACGRVRACARPPPLAASPHQDLPFVKLIEALQPERNAGHSPLVQVVFAFQDSGWQDTRLAGLALAPLVLDTQVARFDLTLAVTWNGTAWQGSLEYDRDRFDAATVERW